MSDEVFPSLDCVSELGSLEYWENYYSTSQRNFADQGQDSIDTWFGCISIRRLENWLKQNSIDQNVLIVDLGCGNGLLLQHLAENGFKNLIGIDYSPNAIQLAKEVSQNKEITFQVADITDKSSEVFNCSQKVDICFDKGTFDAISLCDTQNEEKRMLYIENVNALLKPEGLLIITTCNWTEQEMNLMFQKKFNLKDRIPTKTIQFGGQVGHTVSCLIYRKK